MEACKCDRCGVFYIPEISPKDTAYRWNSETGDDDYVLFRKKVRLDICGSCIASLHKWFAYQPFVDRIFSSQPINEDKDESFDPDNRIDISEGLNPATGEWGHNS